MSETTAEAWDDVRRYAARYIAKAKNPNTLNLAHFLTQALDALAAAEQRIAELEQCAAFVQWVRQEWHHDGDIDGGALQDALTERGLLTPTEVHAPCDPEACQCAEYGEFPVVCYRWADAARQEAAP